MMRSFIYALPCPFLSFRRRLWNDRTRGFSLVELSIVLVILGLLVGGVLAGRSLIRAAELRAVSAEFTRYQAAVFAFRDRYLALPGDMDNATSFWPAASNCNNPHPAGGITRDGTCNAVYGSDGYIGASPIPRPTETYKAIEVYLAWQQLQLAGLIEGSYSGASGSGHSYVDAVAGKNVPASRMGKQVGWCFGATGSTLLSGHNFDVNFYNSIGIGDTYGEGNTNYCGGGIFIPEEAWAIDRKMDDGLPARGKIIAGPITRCTDSWTNATNYDARYSLSGSFSAMRECMLNFSLGVLGSR